MMRLLNTRASGEKTLRTPHVPLSWDDSFGSEPFSGILVEQFLRLT